MRSKSMNQSGLNATSCFLKKIDSKLGSPLIRTLGVALHLEAKPICCERRLKSSLVIAQKAKITPTLLHLP